MILIRLLMFALVAWILWRIYRQLQGPRSPGRPKSGPAEDMVRCASCALHLPRSAALQEEDEWFCCEAHRANHIVRKHRD